ncbi:outer-membrane lipoprotein carrier protein LolA [Pelagibacteraceae bacterium]|nr:outer-membrane lipoprotein carrier protein LolA [Pelagibacteraceae bacterium]
MFYKSFIGLFVFINLIVIAHADEKQLIINKIIGINNITFNFVQTTNNKKELGVCYLVFDNKLKCNYEDSKQKEIIINGNKLVVKHKRYDKIYFYPISKSPFIKIFNKTSLLNLIRESNYSLNKNIELIYIGQNKQKITIKFEKKSYNLLGWKVVDQLQNNINFSIDIKDINSKINSEIFTIPSIN